MFSKIMSIIIFIGLIVISYYIAIAAAMKTHKGKLYNDKKTFWKVFVIGSGVGILLMLLLYKIYTWG